MMKCEAWSERRVHNTRRRVLRKVCGFNKSGHDLTPLSEEEIKNLHLELKELQEEDQASSSSYLGEGKKGLYVAKLGGIPLFSSGCRVDNMCTKISLVFDELADEDHVVKSGMEPNQTLRDVRCGREVAHIYDGYFYVKAEAVLFYELNRPLPPVSQPVNFWGTEGQYTLRQELDGTGPLSY